MAKGYLLDGPSIKRISAVVNATERRPPVGQRHQGHQPTGRNPHVGEAQNDEGANAPANALVWLTTLSPELGHFVQPDYPGISRIGILSAAIADTKSGPLYFDGGPYLVKVAAVPGHALNPGVRCGATAGEWGVSYDPCGPLIVTASGNPVVTTRYVRFIHDRGPWIYLHNGIGMTPPWCRLRFGSDYTLVAAPDGLISVTIPGGGGGWTAKIKTGPIICIDWAGTQYPGSGFMFNKSLFVNDVHADGIRLQVQNYGGPNAQDVFEIPADLAFYDALGTVMSSLHDNILLIANMSVASGSGSGPGSGSGSGSGPGSGSGSGSGSGPGTGSGSGSGPGSGSGSGPGTGSGSGSGPGSGSGSGAGTGSGSGSGSGAGSGAGCLASFADDFNRANNGLGSDWIVHNYGGFVQTQWHIVSNRAQDQDVGQEEEYAFLAEPLCDADHYAEVNAYVNDVGQDDRPGVIGRWQDYENLIWGFTRATGSATYLGKRVAGVWGTVDSGARNRGDGELLRIECNGTAISFDAGVDNYSGTVTELTTLKNVGMFGYNKVNSGASGVKFDNFDSGAFP